MTKLVANLYDKKEYVVCINLKQASLKPYINMNTAEKKNLKNGIEKDFLKLLNDSVFWKNRAKCKKDLELLNL